MTIPKYSAGDKTYTAHWTPTEYTITLDLNGGSGEEKVTYTVEDEDFNLPTPTRLGYEFRGWSGENIGLQKNVTIPKGTTGNKTYTANWKVIQYTLTVISHGQVVEQTKYTVENKIVYLTAGDEPGYTFLGWQEEGTEDVFRTLYYNKGTTGDKTIYKLWTLTEFTITLNLDGGSGEEKVLYTTEDEDFELPTPMRDGYTFKGWTGEGITEPQTSVVIPTGSTGHRTYTANWEEKKYLVRMFCRGRDTNVLLQTVDVMYTPYATPSVPDIDGYEFLYTDTAGFPLEEVAPAYLEKLLEDKQYVECVVYYVKQYTITFDTNGGDPLPPIRYSAYSEPFTLPIPTREGYEFWGWLCKELALPEPGTRTIDPSDDPCNAVCKAQWKEIHTITLDTNGGEPLAPLQYKYNTEAGVGYTLFSDPITLPIPTRAGYDFVGWTGEGFNTPTKNLTVPDEATGDLTYTAHWTPKEYVIVLNLDGGNGEVEVLYTVEDKDFELPIPTRGGYTFLGWTGEGISKPQTKVTIPKGTTGSKVYIANWNLQEIKIYCRNIDSNEIISVITEPYTGEEDFTFDVASREIAGYEFVELRDASGVKQANVLFIPKGSTGNKIYNAYYTKQK